MRAILTYHSIDGSGSPISVAPEEFQAHVRWLAGSGVRVVPLAELLALPAGADAVALTFDDAFLNFGEAAAPLLLEHGLPATLFVVPGHVGGTNAWGGVRSDRVPTLPLLGWEALAALAERGIVLGAHTLTHPHLTQLSGAALAEELGGGAAAIARETGRQPDALAYPYGDVDRAVVDAARADYRIAVTTELRALGAVEEPLALPRLDMYYWRAAGQLEAWGTARFAGRLWARARARQCRRWFSFLGGGW